MAKRTRPRVNPKRRARTLHRQTARHSAKTTGHDAFHPIISQINDNLRALADNLLHCNEPNTPTWRYFPLVLAVAFAVRAAIALASDIFLHPDEIMQYLEPAHRLVFGNGAIYWEYFYGARSYLVPGAIAVILFLCKLVGLDAPFWYVGAVKLAFCALSLLIPAAMYWFARRHFSETAARIALIAGAFWYELAAFAHKPMTEFVATAVLLALLALAARPITRAHMIWLASAVAVLTAAIRLQYAPLALIIFALVFFRNARKLHLLLAAGACLLAVGVFDALTWRGGLFHSYLTNIQFNLNFPFTTLPHPMPAHQFLTWLIIAGGGLTLVCFAGALANIRRYALLLLLALTLVGIHSLQTHKEYRFIFAALPLWLLLGADLFARAIAAAQTCWQTRAPRITRIMTGAGAVIFAVISAAGVANALPFQSRVYWTPFTRQEIVRFLPQPYEQSRAPQIAQNAGLFAAWRHLARDPGVGAIWHPDRHFSATPGYYYLHRKVPIYDAASGQHFAAKLTALRNSVSHIVTARANLSLPGYSRAHTFGPMHIYARDDNTQPVRKWQSYAPHYVTPSASQVLNRIGASQLLPPANWGIRFADE